MAKPHSRQNMDSVLISATGYFPNIGGIENSLYYLSKSFSEKGYSVDLVSSNVFFDRSHHLPRVERSNKFRVLRYNYYIFGKMNAFSGYFNGFLLYRKLKNKKNYKLAVCRDHVTVLLCWLSGFRNIYYVLPGVVKYQSRFGLNKSKGLHKNSFRYLAYRYHHALQYIAVRLSKHNFVFSDEMEKQVSEALNYRMKLKRTTPGVDGDRFRPGNELERAKLRAVLSFNSNDVVLLGLGRFVKEKGYEFAIESISLLPENFHLVLVGSGTSVTDYERLVNRFNLGHRVKILSPTASAEKFYKMADIFLLPSIYEPFGQTLLEAQASGLPVVAFSNIVEGVNTATNDVVINSTSVLAKDLNVESLAECIQHASRKINTGYFDRHHISMYAKDRFSWESTVDDIVSVDNGHS